MYLTQAIHRNAQVARDRIATVCGARRHSWGQLADRIARFAGALQGLGVLPGDRVAILAFNADRYLEYYYAVPWAGAVLVPLNIRWSVAENAYALDDSGSTVLLVDDAFLDTAQALMAQAGRIRAVISLGDGPTPDGLLGYEALIAAAQPVRDSLRRDHDLAGIFYTGGTTGFPKGVMLSHRNLCSSSLSILARLNFHAKDTRYLHAAPMFHLADAAMSLSVTLAASEHVFIPFFEPGHVIRTVAEQGISDVLLVPTMISMLLASPLLASSDLSSLRKVVYGASPMPEGTLLQAMQLLPQVQFYNAYGQTELAPLATILGPEYHVLEGPLAGRLRSAGQAGFCIELRIINADGDVLPPGEVGEVAVRGPNTMMGYWNNPEQTDKALVDGWVHTGDAGYLDDEGFLFLVDRLKDMIVSGGENVFSAEVESALSRHSAVHEVVVIGIPSEAWGESVHAIIRLAPDSTVTEQQLIDHCRSLIAGYKCPRSIEFRDEPFPLTGTGKVRKIDLRTPYWAGKDRAIN